MDDLLLLPQTDAPTRCAAARNRSGGCGWSQEADVWVGERAGVTGRRMERGKLVGGAGGGDGEGLEGQHGSAVGMQGGKGKREGMEGRV